jgi:hypothetical protein
MRVSFGTLTLALYPSPAHGGLLLPACHQGVYALVARGARCAALLGSLRTIAAGAGLIFTSAPASAQDWPARPVTMVVPFAAGSGSDILGRIIGPRLAESLGAPVIVENVGGAGA